MRFSLSFRLLLLATATTIIALTATALVLNFLFRAYFNDRIRNELDTYLVLVTGNIGLDDKGEVGFEPIIDPRFSQPLSGYYWQIKIDNEEEILSPSFWATPMQLPRPVSPGQIQYVSIETGTREHVSTASWMIILDADDARHEVLVIVGIDQTDIDLSTAGFFTYSAIWLGAMGIFLLSASWFQVRIGLKPLEKVKSEITQIITSPNSRLSLDYPTEVLPLVEGVNSLQEANEKSLENARAHAGNLAHGLKTPLTICQSIAYRLRNSDQVQMATQIEGEINNMQHIIERELALGRDSKQVVRFCEVEPIAARLTNMLSMQPNEDHIKWDVAVPNGVMAPFDEHDLTEMLGNLLDNAMKWTADHILIVAEEDEIQTKLRIEDNGPGIQESARSIVLERGKRLNSEQAGAGFGLAIVLDMANAHGCKLSLESSELGGLSVELSWPKHGT